MRFGRSAVIAVFSFVMLGLHSCIDKPEGVDTATQLRADVAVIDEYIAANGLHAYQDKRGIRFVIDTLGTGFPPRLDQGFKAKYVGKLMDGTVFDPGPETSGVLGNFITGWQDCLSIWPVGTKGKLFVPSPLGYSTVQVNSIPPNSILMFDLELTEAVLANAEKARLTADINTIDQYLADHEIDAVKDSTGVRYVISEPGGGAMPSWFSKVKFNYSGRALNAETPFFTGYSEPDESFDSRVVDFIHGIKVGLMKLPVGGKMTIYIPSLLAFGTTENPQAALPANSIVVYELELLEIVN